MPNDEFKSNDRQEFVEGFDYYFNDDGRLVMTAKYLFERGYCCGNGCLNCPYPKDVQAAAMARLKSSK